MIDKISENTQNKKIVAIGLMSGTSMDGIDAAIIETDGINVTNNNQSISLPYTDDIRSQIKQAIINKSADSELEDELTKLNAKAVGQLINKYNLTEQQIDVIGYHGQTIFHDAANKKTIQVGNGRLLSQLTGINVVNDFRSNDVKNGGQGAPFAPLYHASLVKEQKLPAAIINIGGVGNISWIGDDNIIAFDTGPGNALIDDLIYEKTGKYFDKNGELASKGRVHNDIVDELMQNPFFDAKPPKSLDRQDFSSNLIKDLSTEDAAATLTAFTVASIAKAFEHVPQVPDNIYITGGGRHNGFMMELLAKETGKAIGSIEELGTDGDMVEAQAFAFLAVRSLYNMPLSLPSTTGVKTPLTGGVFYERSKVGTIG